MSNKCVLDNKKVYLKMTRVNFSRAISKSQSLDLSGSTKLYDNIHHVTKIRIGVSAPSQFVHDLPKSSGREKQKKGKIRETEKKRENKKTRREKSGNFVDSLIQTRFA